MKTSSIGTKLLLLAITLGTLIYFGVQGLQYFSDPLTTTLVYAYQVVFCIPVMIWAVAMATLSRFTFKTKELLGAACKLVFSNLPMAILVAVILALGLKLMSWWFISCIFTPALMAYLCTFPVEKIFAPFLPEEEEYEYDEE